VVATTATAQSIASGRLTQRHTLAAAVSPTAANRAAVPSDTAITSGRNSVAPSPQARPRRIGSGFIAGDRRGGE